jgi:hypothetical protein
VYGFEGLPGVYAVDWQCVRLDGQSSTGPGDLLPGMTFVWAGHALRLDGPTEIAVLAAPRRDQSQTRNRARMRAGRIAGPAGAVDTETPDSPPPGGIVLTDGRSLFPARLILRPAGSALVFSPRLPPAGRMLWVLAIGPALPATAPEVICFLPGTLIDTPRGARAIESLRPGDAIQTRDDGAQRLLWLGETRVSGAELYLNPALRPLRIATDALAPGAPCPDLRVSPGHRLLIGGAGGLFGADEVLVRARDLEDGHAVRRDFALREARYLHLMLPFHSVIRANGVWCESYHPALGATDAGALAAAGLAQPGDYGPEARRCLSRAEAAVLGYGAG